MPLLYNVKNKMYSDWIHNLYYICHIIVWKKVKEYVILILVGCEGENLPAELCGNDVKKGR